MTAQLHTISRVQKVLQPIKKLIEISMLNAKGITLKKINADFLPFWSFHS